MRKPLLAAPVAAMLTPAATTSTLIQIVARSSPRLPRYRQTPDQAYLTPLQPVPAAA
jgi:hypothetical protein